MPEQDLQKKLTDLLRALHTSTPGVFGASVISTDGFAIATELPQSVEERCVAAMAAAMLALNPKGLEILRVFCFTRALTPHRVATLFCSTQSCHGGAR